MVPSQLPPVTALTNRQTPGITGGARRLAAWCHAATAASSAARSTDTANVTASPPSATTRAAKAATKMGARARCRRRQLRTVLWGTSTVSATGRAPAPEIISANASPITPTGSSRCLSRKSGSNA